MKPPSVFAAVLLLCFPAPFRAVVPGDSLRGAWLEPWLLEFSVQSHQLALPGRSAGLGQDRRAGLRRQLNVRPSAALVWEYVALGERLNRYDSEQSLRLLKLRYAKGIELVKMLYEKILSMDHHFSSLKAQQELLQLSNPHYYPDFKLTRQIIDEKVRRKYGFQLPAVLQTNPYVAAAFSILGLVLSPVGAGEKQVEAEKIACVLDFTVRMHHDLSVIYFETGYLREANLTLKKACESLFSDCARQVDYRIPLDICRSTDDWERLFNLLDQQVDQVLQAARTGDEKLLVKTEANLRFAIDRIVQFINRYSDFVNQGNEYYKKFGKIAGAYQNELVCAASLPDSFRQLKTDIEQTLEKFNSAYCLPEVQGSRLKDLLYGE